MTKGKFVQFIWLIIAVYACFTLSKSLWQLYQAGERVTTQASKLSELKGQVAGLQARLEYVRSYEFLEKEARDKLNLQRPGEIVLVVPETQLVVRPEGIENSEENLANWQKWLKLFL